MERKRILEGLKRLAGAGPAGPGEALADLYASDAEWRGAHPLNEMRGTAAIAERVWAPLLRAFPDLERRDTIFVGGSYQGRDYIAALGHYSGTFERDWLGIPATGGAIFLRYGEVHELRGGRIVQSNCLWDVLDLIRQAGFWPVAPSLGVEGMWPGPITCDGIVLAPQDPAQGAASIAQTLAMHATLGAYDDEAKEGRDGLLNMPQKQHWHPKMMWYGPSGIGTARGLAGFVDCHQLPFRTAFPKSQGRRPMGRDRFPEGRTWRRPLHPHRRRPLFRYRRLAERLCQTCRRRLHGPAADRARRDHAGDGFLPP